MAAAGQFVNDELRVPFRKRILPAVGVCHQNAAGKRAAVEQDEVPPSREMTGTHQRDDDAALGEPPIEFVGVNGAEGFAYEPVMLRGGLHDGQA